MTTNRGLVNPQIIGIMSIAASVLLVTTESQNAMAQLELQIPPDFQAAPPSEDEVDKGTASDVDIIVEEIVEAGNMTGTNSTG